MDWNSVLFAFGLTVFAGLSTGFGSLIALLTKRTNEKFLSVTLGFSAGVMIYVSLVEIFVKAKDSLTEATGDKLGYWLTVAGFFGGIMLIALIDKFVPDKVNPHEIHHVEELEDGSKVESEVSKKSRLMRMGLLSALALAIHNFPEGLATFLAALKDPSLGIPVAVAIAIHNIPEGIAVSIPVFYATGDRKKAFTYSFLSGLAEPVGVIVGYSILYNFMNDIIFGILFAMVAGIMVFISIDELLPTAQEYGEHHLSIYGLIAGMALMAVSLLLFA